MRINGEWMTEKENYIDKFLHHLRDMCGNLREVYTLFLASSPQGVFLLVVRLVPWPLYNE